MHSLVLLSLVFTLLNVLVYRLATSSSSGSETAVPKDARPLPGPAGYPLVGNLPQIPAKHSWLQFHRWSQQYGPIYRLNLAGSTHVIVCSEQIANDLCRERGNIYSDRPQSPMAARLLSNNLRPLLLPYGDIWRAFRKFTHAVAMHSVAATYAPVQEEEALRLVHDLIRSPARYETLMERYAASIIMRINYGITISTDTDPVLKRIVAVNHHLERIASPGAYLVDTFPILMHLPDWLAPFKREGKRLHAEEYDLFSSLVSNVADRTAKGDPSTEGTMTKLWLDTKEKYRPQLTDPHAHYLLGTIFEAGAGTSSAALMSFLLAMVLYPDKFDKLVAEIDSVIADDQNRLPNLEDLPRLPYLRACVKETLRWRPVVAGGLPHFLSARDDIYTTLQDITYHIPRGSTIHPVQWAIHRDPVVYPDAPEEFLPERWLELQYKATYKEPLTEFPNLRDYSCFGFGRRICPGRNIAERGLMIAALMVGWGCEIWARRSGERNGEVCWPEKYDYTAGFNAQPKWFDFELRGRKGREGVLGREFARVWGSTEEDQFVEKGRG